jgi:hypothetical protein
MATAFQASIDALITKHEAADAASLKAKDATITTLKAQLATAQQMVAQLQADLADCKAHLPPPTTTSPPTTTPPPVTGFPDAITAGVPAGTVLAAYTGPQVIADDGAVISGFAIKGGLRIVGKNVTIRNCSIVYGTADIFALDVAGTGLTVDHCTIVGPGMAGDSPAGISCDAGDNTFIGNDISGCEHAIVFGPGRSVARGNYLHNPGSNKADPHVGGFSLKGGQDDVLIEGNTVVGIAHLSTSDVFIQDNWGPINNVRVNHNLLIGDPGYNVYVEGRLGNGTTNVSVTNNVLSTPDQLKEHYGYFSIDQASPTITGNVDQQTGLPANA